MYNKTSLEILGEALARTFEKFAQDKIEYHGKKIVFDRDTFGEFVGKQKDVGNIKLSSGTGLDSVHDIGITIYTDIAEGIMTFDGYHCDANKHGIGALSPHEIDENGDENSATLVAVAIFLQEHFGYAQSEFFNDLSYQIDTIRSEIQLERKAQSILDKLRL